MILCAGLGICFVTYKGLGRYYVWVALLMIPVMVAGSEYRKRENRAILNKIPLLLVGIIIPYILAKVTKGLGEGDIGLYGLCCFVLGKNYSIYLIFLSFILASIYCMYILLTKSDKIRKIPFAPFISLATILIILTNFDILNFWFNIISN